MKKKVILLFVAFLTLLNGCACGVTDPKAQSEQLNLYTETTIPSSTLSPTATNTPSPTDTPTVTIEPTPTRTPLPTIVKRPPTVTVERPVEWDIEPYIEKRIDTEWKGVRIKASFIIDSSLQDRIESIEISNWFFAELIQRAMFIAWYIRQNPSVEWARPGYATAENIDYRVVDVSLEEYNVFLDLWSTAQKSGEESDWRKVQINNIWANDLSDDNGYIQSPYNFWPMYEGAVPNGVTAMNRFTVVLTDSSSTSNIAKLKSIYSVGLDIGYGFNLDNGDMMFYFANPLTAFRCEAHYKNKQNCLKDFILAHLSNIGHELVLNRGEAFIDYHSSADIYIYSLGIEKNIDIEIIVD